MVEVLPFPFAEVADLKARWAEFPTGGDAHATVLLEDASQFMLDAYPESANVSVNTRKRIVCAVVRRAMQVESLGIDGMESVSIGTGPFSDAFKPLNPHGDFYLTEQEIRSLGLGKGRKQSAFSIDLLAVPDATG